MTTRDNFLWLASNLRSAPLQGAVGYLLITLSPSIIRDIKALLAGGSAGSSWFPPLLKSQALILRLLRNMVILLKPNILPLFNKLFRGYKQPLMLPLQWTKPNITGRTPLLNLQKAKSAIITKHLSMFPWRCIKRAKIDLAASIRQW